MQRRSDLLFILRSQLQSTFRSIRYSSLEERTLFVRVGLVVACVFVTCAFLEHFSEPRTLAPSGFGCWSTASVGDVWRMVTMTKDALRCLAPLAKIIQDL